MKGRGEIPPEGLKGSDQAEEAEAEARGTESRAGEKRRIDATDLMGEGNERLEDGKSVPVGTAKLQHTARSYF